MKLSGYIFLFWLCSNAAVQAVEVEVRYEDKTYFLNAAFEVEATSARVMNVLTDYEAIVELGPSIIISEVLGTPTENTTRVRTVVKDCILFFCRKVARVEDIVQTENEKLEAVIIPLLSDLRSGSAVWELHEHETGTSVQYNANFQSKFWIPPIIRSHVLTKKFKNRVREAVQRLQIKVDHNEQTI